MELTIYIVALVFLMYVYIFIEHSSIIKMFLACFSSYIVFQIMKLMTNDNSGKTSYLERMTLLFKTLDLDIQPHWVCIDTNIAEFIFELEPIIKYDVQIVSSIITELTNFTKTYYRKIQKDDKIMYKNLETQKHIIQKLVDIHDTILDELNDVIYVMKFKTYKYTLNIPHKITVIDTILQEKIKLIAHKYKFHTSVLNTV